MNAPAILPHRQRNARIFAKDPHGWYVEPKDCTAALASAVNLYGRTWDPACGLGHVVAALRELGVPAVGTDLVRRVDGEPDWFICEHDFLGDDASRGTPLGELFWPDNIVCNPPSAHTEAFIRRALVRARRTVAMFTNVRFLFGRERALRLWREQPPTRILFVTPRPACPPGDYILAGGKPEGGMGDWVWLVWTRGEAPHPPSWIVRPK